MARPWYPRYPDDYARKTPHCSLAEHGAYSLLMDQYYRTGEPLPSCEAALSRICRVQSKAELKAVTSILTQFFERRGERLHNLRADEEIVRAMEIQEKRIKGGNARAHAAALAKACAQARDLTECQVRTRAIQPQSQLQEESKTEPSLGSVGFAVAKPKKGTRWESTRIVEKDWISDAFSARQKHELPGIDLELEAEHFAHFWASKSGANATKLDWRRAFIGWCLKAEGKRNGIPRPNGGTQTGSRFERLAALRQQALADERAAQILED